MEPVRSEYVTEVGYVRNFEPSLAPAGLRLVAALNGFVPPPAEDFDYCELGCGQGDTLVALAAANPRARFVGVDINPTHVRFARQLAGRGGVENVRFEQADFAELHPHELGTFDFVAAHGVLSWVSPAQRAAVVRLASGMLRPGGLLYVSYNALPGWAAVEPLRQLLVDAAGDAPPLEAARRGVELARRLRDAGAGYFADNPPAREMLATLEQLGLEYVVHEYLHAHWSPMYFAEVSRELAAGDLYFAGNLPLHLNYRDLALTPALAGAFASAQDRGSFEVGKGYALNEYFRRDVFVRGRAAAAASARDAYLASTAFASAEAAGPAVVELPGGVLRCDEPVHRAVSACVGQDLATLAEVRERLGMHDAASVEAAWLRLIVAQHLLPAHATSSVAAPPGDAAYVLCGEYNRMALQQPFSRETPLVLASPRTGSGLILPALQAIVVRALCEAERGQHLAWIDTTLQASSLRVKVEGRWLDEPAARRQVVRDELERFVAQRLDYFVRSGILAATQRG